jgi:hypothetical protein
MIAVEVVTQSGRFNVGRKQFAGDGRTASYEIPSTGDMNIAVSFIVDGKAVARADRTYSLYEDAEWRMSLMRGDTAVHCVGCQPSIELQVPALYQSRPGESVWLLARVSREGEIF